MIISILVLLSWFLFSQSVQSVVFRLSSWLLLDLVFCLVWIAIYYPIRGNFSIPSFLFVDNFFHLSTLVSVIFAVLSPLLFIFLKIYFCSGFPSRKFKVSSSKGGVLLTGLFLVALFEEFLMRAVVMFALIEDGFDLHVSLFVTFCIFIIMHVKFISFSDLVDVMAAASLFSVSFILGGLLMSSLSHISYNLSVGLITEES